MRGVVFVPSLCLFISFVEFLIAIVCWVVDNGFCAVLRKKLMFYPQTHAWWHFWTVAGLYHMSLVTEVCERLVEKKIGIEENKTGKTGAGGAILGGRRVPQIKRIGWGGFLHVIQ